MLVYVLESQSEDGTGNEVEGVFSTLEKAEDYAWRLNNDPSMYDAYNYTISEEEVDSCCEGKLI